jgi:hypothetical protein
MQDSNSGLMTSGQLFSWDVGRVLEVGGYAMLSVLLSTAPLQAQSVQDLMLALQPCRAAANRQVLTAAVPLSFDSAMPSTANAIHETGVETDSSFQFSRGNLLGSSQDSLETTNFCGNSAPIPLTQSSSAPQLEKKTDGNGAGVDSKEHVTSISQYPQQLDLNQNIYYRNKLEFSLEGGWLPVNIPFPFDFLFGSGYRFPGLYYTLVPIMASVRWHLDDVAGPSILRGNWDASFTASVTVIPRGAETRYFSYIMGIRRNFVPHRWRAVPYFDGQLGMGNIDAKGPYGVKYAQGQNFTFTLNLGSGVRYNLNPRYSVEGGLHYMHISNLYLSEPKFLNYGINVYGPWAGINIRIGKPRSANN